jgi:hypothetical protein
MIRRIIAVTVALTARGTTHAETRGTFRLGVLPLDLEASADTPLFGARIERAVDDYNTAADAHDRMTGATTARIDTSDLGVTETLLVFAPGFEQGSGVYFFRMEAPIGIANDLRSIGLGLYPVNLQVPVGRSAAIYGSGGAIASWLDRPGSGDVGALVMVRAAAGFRAARHVVFELGYNAYALGGNVNSGRLADMAEARTLAEPDKAISGGDAKGIVDASLGLAF